MKLYHFLQVYLVIFVVRGDCGWSIQDKENNSSEIEATTRKPHGLSKDLGYSLEMPSHVNQVAEIPKHRRHKHKRRQKDARLIVGNTRFHGYHVTNCMTDGQKCNKTTYVMDSLEREQNVTQAESVVTEYLEEFTKASPIPVTANATTIGQVTWSYQGNKSSEESDESKSTLIDYPFSVSIQRKGAHYASGALLDKFWVITAAGEFYNVRESLKLFRVRLGSVDCKSGGTVLPIKQIEIHPYYVYGKPNFDVALLRMAMYVDYNSFIRPIVISNIKGRVLSAKFMTTYWPRILIKGSILPQHARERVKFNSMRVSTQRLLPEKECSAMLKNMSVVLNESCLCLKPVVTHHSVCTPDVGAPVLAEDGLWGITSGWVSPLCPAQASPTLFTRLSSTSVRSWLESHVQTLG